MGQETKRQSESGSALVYILIAIALLAALTISFMEPSSQQTSSQNTFKSAAVIQGQADTIRSAVQECVLMYPNGDSTIDTTTGTGDDPDANTRYPINPNSDHYTGSTLGLAGDREVRNIRCPGHSTGAANDHAPIFAGSSGKFMPPPPDLFGEWQWYNGVDGVFYWIETDKTDAYIKAALDKLDDKFGECEADVTVSSGSDTAYDSAGATGVECPDGSTCFRVWMVQNASAVAVDAGCP